MLLARYGSTCEGVCEEVLSMRPTSKPPTPTVRPPQRHLMAFRPQEVLAVDFLKLDRGLRGYEDVLVLTDVFSKYSQAVPCRDQSSETVAKVVRDHWISHYGIPGRIHSDQGRCFESTLVLDLCRLYGIKKSRTTAYHPSGNGQCERFNKTLCGLLRSVDPKERRRWPEMIQHVVHMYNTTPHRITRVTPYFLMFGRTPILPIDHLLNKSPIDLNDYGQEQQRLVEQAHRKVSDRQKEAAMKEEKRQQKKERGSVAAMEIGDRVLLHRDAFTGRHKLVDKFYERPYVVVAKNKEEDVYQIRPISGGEARWVNRRRLVEDPRQEDRGIDKIFPYPLDDVEAERELRRHVDDNMDDVDVDIDTSRNDDDGDSDDEDDIPGWLYLSNKQGLRNSEPEVEAPVRRSARNNKGVNRNPFRLPTSSITGLPT